MPEPNKPRDAQRSKVQDRTGVKAAVLTSVVNELAMTLDAGSRGKYYVLDMGSEKYGDSLLCVFGTTTVLIDGGHRSDYAGQSGFDSIPKQLSELLSTQSPFKISLLIVTHCHADHIGALPQMVANGDLVPEWALVADEKLGFGRTSDGGGQDSYDAASDAVQRVVAALREEPQPDLSDSELDRFLEDAVTLEQRYKDMLKALSDRGTRLLRYGRDKTVDLESQFASTGIKVLGPTQDHLVLCADAIAKYTKDTVDAVRSAMASDAALSERNLYRQLATTRPISDLADRIGKGAALNDQSIVLRFGPSADYVLLAGDMQFAQPEVPGLDDEMAKLLKEVNNAGPYKFIKLTHHSSYNGLDEAILNYWSATKLFAHTGGQKDPDHPDPGSLQLLKTNRSRLNFAFARTDRNGRIAVDTRNGFTVSRGRLNDFTENTGASSGGDVQRPPAHQIEITEMPPATGAHDMVEVIARVPVQSVRVTLTIDVEPKGPPATYAPPQPSLPHDRTNSPALRPPSPSPDPEASKLAAGRQLPKLLFVTNRPALVRNVGPAADTALNMIRKAGHPLLDIQNPSNPGPEVRANFDPSISGVVVVGGYDVLPSQRLDVLTPKMRSDLSSQTRNDDDSFIIWSDGFYADASADGMPDTPVSRIPDGNSGALLLTALRVGGVQIPNGRYGIRNSLRPFADKIWSTIQGQAAMLISGPTKAAGVVPAEVQAQFVYFMLHGSNADTSRFWGEGPGLVEAFNVNCVPDACDGVVFAGCCWGALTVDQIASRYTEGALKQRGLANSIALKILAAGATAFVGCTGTHYSPDNTAAFAGGPMHAAFWQHLVVDKQPPALALFNAGIDYISGMPHNQTDLFDQAIERKILKEFTCLGLGW